MNKQHNWRELKKLVPNAPNEICRDVFEQLPFEDALNFLRESFDQKQEKSPEITPKMQKDMVKQIMAQFPTLDKDIALAILEDANNYLDVALENCRQMEQEYNKFINSYVPNEDLLYVDGPIIDNFNEEEENDQSHQTQSTASQKESEKWTITPPIIIQEPSPPKIEEKQPQHTFLIKKPTIIQKPQIIQHDATPFILTPPIIIQAGNQQNIQNYSSLDHEGQIVLDLNEVQNPNKQQWNPFYNITPSELHADSSSLDNHIITYSPTFSINQDTKSTQAPLKIIKSSSSDIDEIQKEPKTENKKDFSVEKPVKHENDKQPTIHIEKKPTTKLQIELHPHKEAQVMGEVSPNLSIQKSSKYPPNIEELVLTLQSICEGFERDVLLSTLEKFNYNIERCVNYLFDQQSPKKQIKQQKQPEKPQKLSKRQKKMHERFEKLPEKYRIYDETEEEKREKKIKYLQEMFPNAEPSYIATILDQSRGDLSGAVSTLSKAEYLPEREDHLHPFDMLRNVFPSARDYEIDAALEKANGNPDLAGQYILTQTFDKPPPEDAILAIRPDISAAHARKILQRANGDIKKAIEECSKIGPLRVSIKQQEKPVDPYKSLTIDLHNYRADDAADFVTRVIRNARGSFGVLYFITGKGHNSKDHIPILRPLVMKICRKAGANTKLLPTNSGIVECRFVPLPY